MRKEYKGRKSYAVFGMGEFGKSVAIELAKVGVDVMAIDKDQEKLEDVAGFVTDARQLDATDCRAYEKLGLSNIDTVVVAIAENMDAALMAILQAEEAGVTDIVVKALNEIQAKIFSKVGATRIITPEKSEGVRLARTLAREDIFEFVELRENICMIEISPRKEWIGKSLKELNLRNKHQINVIAILKDGKADMAINPDTVLRDNVHLLIATGKGNVKNI